MAFAYKTMSVTSWDGNAINEGTNYRAKIIGKAAIMQEVEVNNVLRAGTNPVYANVVQKGKNIPLHIEIRAGSELDIAKWFDPSLGLKKLIVTNTADASTWYVYAKVMQPPVFTSKNMRLLLYAPDPVWRKDSTTTTNWSITASGDTKVVANGGNKYAKPVITLSPTSAKAGGFGKRRWIRAYNPNAYPLLNEAIDVTDGGIDLTGLVQADLDDARVYVDNAEVMVWPQGTAASFKLWTEGLDFPAKTEVKILAAISNVGAVTSIQLQNTSAAKTAMAKVAKTNGIIVEVDNERFWASAYNPTTRTFTISLRAIRASAAAAHIAGATLKIIPFDIWLFYENSSLTAPEVSDLYKPAWELTSTNDTRSYLSFGNKAATRPGSWVPNILGGYQAQVPGEGVDYYTGNRGDTEADPITEIGVAVRPYNLNGKLTPTSGNVAWDFVHNGGITSITFTGEKFRFSTLWATFFGLKISKDGKAWVTKFSEATPASANTWATITNTSAQALGATYRFARVLLLAQPAAIVSNSIMGEMESATVVLAGPVDVTVSAQENNYEMDAQLYNQTTGESIFIKGTFALTDVITINQLTRKVALQDGTNVYNAISLDSKRTDWMTLAPGNNTLQFIDVGTAAVTGVITHEDRNL